MGKYMKCWEGLVKRPAARDGGSLHTCTLTGLSITGVLKGTVVLYLPLECWARAHS